MNKLMMPIVEGTQSIRRAVALLRALAEHGVDGASVAELAISTSLDRTTSHRILKGMAAEGLLRYARETKRYFLGSLAFDIGVAVRGLVDLRALCGPALARLAGELGDTIFLIARTHFESTCVDRVEGSYPVKTFVMDIGARRPLGVGAGSMAILAGLPNDEISAVLDHNRHAIHTFSGITVERLRRLAAETRRNQYASMDVISVPDVRAVAVALRAADRRPVAALSVAAIHSRMTRERQHWIADVLHKEAASLSNLLGASRS